MQEQHRRIAYLALRLRQAGLRASIDKMGGKLKPYVFWPHYALSNSRGSPKSKQSQIKECDALKEFGEMCRQAFLDSSVGASGQCAQAAKRLDIAQSVHFPVLGYGDLKKPSGSGWHCDALHGYCWPISYFARCDFVAADVRADVKIPWELSRLQWLVWLAEAAVDVSQCEKEALKEQFLGTLRDWENANPVGYGINWTCGMEVAIRATNLVVAAGVFAQLLADEDLEFVTSVLLSHQKYLKRFPEISDVPGNHYLADLMGEVVLHAALDGLQSVPFEQALARFSQVAEAQFEEDGCHVERSTIYHRLAYDMVALPFALALRAKSPQASKLAGVVAKAGAFMGQIANDAGRLPIFGDQDSGFVLWFGECAQQVDRRICKAGSAPETALYSFLAALAQDVCFLPDVKRLAGTRSGFATVESEGFRAVLKTGPIGLKGRAPHDHDDALAVCVSWKSRPLIVDPGCHSYTLDPELRRESIVSSRHNAPVPAGRERHMPSQGSINATVRGGPTAQISSWDKRETRGELAPTLSSRMHGSRSVAVHDGQITIADRWRYIVPESTRILWLFGPMWALEWPYDKRETLLEDRVVRLQCDEESLDLKIEAPIGARLSLVLDRMSPDYGAFVDCAAIQLSIPAAENGWAKTRILGKP